MTPLLLRGQQVFDGASLWAEGSGGNLLSVPATELVGPGCSRLWIRSGWIVDDPDAPALERIPWASPARGKFDQAIEGIVPLLADCARTLLILPRLGDLLSDIPSTLAFVRRWSSHPIGVLLEPSALLSPEMVDKADEHLNRIGEALGAHDATAGVLLTNFRLVGHSVVRSPVHSGLIEPGMLAEFARAATDRGKPVVLLDDDLAAQYRVLSRIG